MVSDERALAVRLASTDDDALARTFAERGVSPAALWHDFFDAAAGMLDPASVERAVARLPRTALVSLAAALNGSVVDSAEAGVLRPLALVAEDGAPYGAVAARVRTLAAARPDAFVAEPVDPPVAAAAEVDAAAAAEKAFTTVGALADVLLAGLNTPLSRTGTGAVSAIDRRRLTDAGVHASPEDIDDLVAAADAADLVLPVGREWIVTGVRSAVARSHHDTALVDRRDGSALSTAAGAAHRRRRIPPPVELGGRLPPARRVDRPGRAPAPHRRDVGPARPLPAPNRSGRHPSAAGSSRAPTSFPRTFLPRSIACTSRPT